MKNKITLTEKKLTLEIFTEGEKSTTYDFSEGVEFVNDRGKIVLYHGAIMNLANELGIEVSEPEVITSYNRIHFVIGCTATYLNRKELGIGEANKENLVTEIARQYPFITAYTRAYDRAVLSVLGFAGKIFSDSEISIPSSSDEKIVEGNVKVPTDEEMQKETETDQDSFNSVPVETPKAETQKVPDKKAANNSNPAAQESDKTDKPSPKDIYGSQYGDEINPDTFIITVGLFKDERITPAELYKKDPAALLKFAKKRVSDNEEYNKNIFACRRELAKHKEK